MTSTAVTNFHTTTQSLTNRVYLQTKLVKQLPLPYHYDGKIHESISFADFY